MTINSIFEVYTTFFSYLKLQRLLQHPSSTINAPKETFTYAIRMALHTKVHILEIPPHMLTRLVLTFDKEIISKLGRIVQDDWAHCTIDKIHVTEDHVCGMIVGINKLALEDDCEKVFQTICVFTGWVHIPPKEMDGYKLVMVKSAGT